MLHRREDAMWRVPARTRSHKEPIQHHMVNGVLVDQGTPKVRETKHDISFMHTRRFPKLAKIVNEEPLPDVDVITRRRARRKAGAYANTEYAHSYSQSLTRLHPDLFKNVVYESDLSKYRAHLVAKTKKLNNDRLLRSVGFPPGFDPSQEHQERVARARRRRARKEREWSRKRAEEGYGDGDGSEPAYEGYWQRQRRLREKARSQPPPWRPSCAADAKDFLKSELHIPPLGTGETYDDAGAVVRAVDRRRHEHQRAGTHGASIFKPSSAAEAKAQIGPRVFLDSCDTRHKHEQLQFMRTRELQQEAMFQAQEARRRRGKLNQAPVGCDYDYEYEDDSDFEVDEDVLQAHAASSTSRGSTSAVDGDRDFENRVMKDGSSQWVSYKPEPDERRALAEATRQTPMVMTLNDNDQNEKEDSKEELNAHQPYTEAELDALKQQNLHFQAGQLGINAEEDAVRMRERRLQEERDATRYHDGHLYGSDVEADGEYADEEFDDEEALFGEDVRS